MNDPSPSPPRAAERDVPTELGPRVFATDPALTLAATPEPANDASVERASVGRYRLERRLGVGGMGTVYEARDVDLGRRVAIKLVHAHLSERARQRMQREALALARLSHPNVVQIYEIGQRDGQTFIVMELVRGQTLHAWQQRSPRPSWREVLRVYAQAGEGLAAAHAEELVHRDFKPSNCMLGDDGRVRVLDFGLAKDAHDEPEAPSRETSEPDGAAILTRTGVLMGTPAYMAPEQLGRGPVGPLADQFGFCVSVYQALYGQRPFAGETLSELCAAVLAGHVQPAPREAMVPHWVDEVVRRGLSPDPAARWPSMRALLDALADDPSRRRRTQWMIVGGLALLAAGTWGLVTVFERDEASCHGAQARLAGAWDEERRAAVEQAVLATGTSYAADTWERVEAHLDRYAEAWVDAHVDACEATHRGAQSTALLDRRMACLDERRQYLRATVDELARADPRVVSKAVSAVLELPGLDACADAKALLAVIPPPEDPAVAAQATAIDAGIVECEILSRAGRIAEGMPRLESLVADATALGYEPLMARAWLKLGIMQDDAGQPAAAVSTLERAYDAALAHSMLYTAGEAATRLVAVHESLARFEEARRWMANADPLARASPDSSSLRPAFFVNSGLLALAEGEHALAGERFEQALALQEEALGPQHPSVARTLGNLGVVAIMQGDRARAQQHFERALAILEEALGSEHPDTAVLLGNLGRLAVEQGDRARARGHLERALAIQRKALGPQHPALAWTLGHLGRLAQLEQQWARAREHFEQALAIQEAALGPEHPEVGARLAELAAVERDEGELATAQQHLERALKLMERGLGPEHPTLAGPLLTLGEVVEPQGQPARAQALCQRALTISERTLGPAHAELFGPLLCLGRAALQSTPPSQAIAPLERAVALGVAEGVAPVELAAARFALARALWAAPAALGRDRERARTLAVLARDALTQAGAPGARDLTVVTAWLHEHDRP